MAPSNDRGGSIEHNASPNMAGTFLQKREPSYHDFRAGSATILKTDKMTIMFTMVLKENYNASEYIN